MTLDFGVLPPEINSGRMYLGPGSGPLLAAASAWDEVASELSVAASGYTSQISELTSSPWVGPASQSMTAAVTPYMSWLSSTATQAQIAADKARAAAAEFETAFAATVPPPVIAANRVLLATLVATNFLGINTPAIMATEAQYVEMWAQDAATMYTYAGAALANLAAWDPFSSAPQTTNESAAAQQTQAVTNATAQPAGTAAQNVSAAVSNLPLPPTIQDLLTQIQTFIANDSNYEAILTGLTPTARQAIWRTFPGLGYFSNGIASFFTNIAQQSLSRVPEAAGGAPFGPPPLLRGATSGGLGAGNANLVSATAGQAGKIGGLSVPSNWTAPESAAAERAGMASLVSNAADEDRPQAWLRGIPPGTGSGRREGQVVVKY